MNDAEARAASWASRRIVGCEAEWHMLTAEMEQAKFDVQRVAEQQAMGRLLAAIPAAAIEGRFTFSPVEGGCVRMTLVVLSADGLR